MSEIPKDAQFATKAVHAGLEPDPTYGSVIPAVHFTSTYVQGAPGEFVGDFDYSRAGNPTRTQLEKALGILEGGIGLAWSSGMAATHAVLTATCQAGDHVILPDDLYGGTYRLVDKILTKWGLDYTMVDQQELDNVSAAITPQTKLIWVETPTNPTLKTVDIAEVAKRAGDVPVAVDNTFATPLNQQPLTLGAQIVVHSTTKYLGGHSDVVGGATIVSDPELQQKLKFVQLSIGAVPGPMDCFLVHRGLRTLHLRMQAAETNARAIVDFLQDVPDVAEVFYPGFGAMVSFRHPDALGIVARTSLFSLAESLGGVESLIEVPQAMTHQSVEGSAAAVPADLIRVSCGIEAPEDLVEDLRRAIS
jgi:cystathionine gamma-synthase